MSRVAVFFIVQGYGLQAQAILLASSLRAHLGADVQVIGYLPDAEDPPAGVRAALSHFDVALERFEVPAGTWAKPYPHGNKIIACQQKRGADIHVFLDTDMVMVAPIDYPSIMVPGAVSLVPEGTPTWGKKDDRWERVYAHFGLELPTERVRLTRRRRREFYPYFNAGMVAFHDAYGGRSFGDLWYETAREIDFNCGVGAKRPWLDQIALPLTCATKDVAYHVVEPEFNFSISDRAFEADKSPKLLHYHRWRYGPAWPQFRVEFERMQSELGATRMKRLPKNIREIFEDVSARLEAS